MIDSQHNSNLSTFNIPNNIGAIELPKLTSNANNKKIRVSDGIKKDSIPLIKEFSEQSHQYMREYIRNADQKAIFYFTICSGLLAFMQTQHATTRWLKKFSIWSALDFITFLAMFCLTVSAIFFIAVIIPRLKGSRRGIIYFNAISEYESADEYATNIMQSQPEVLIKAKLCHCYELSEICKAKYSMLNYGIYIWAVGSLATIIYLLCSSSV